MTHDEALCLFKRVGEFELSTVMGTDEKLLIFGPRIQHSDERPCVYAWVEEQPGGNKRILYIGKSGLSLEKRHSQHATGFQHSKRGQSHRSVLEVLLLANARVSVWVMHPEPFRWEGYEVPSHASVEEFLIRTIQPTPERNSQARRSSKMET